MKKLKLSLDDLRVTAFTTNFNHPEVSGTVHARESEIGEVCGSLSDWEHCGGDTSTCVGTYIRTCACAR